MPSRCVSEYTTNDICAGHHEDGSTKNRYMILEKSTNYEIQKLL